jgi:hypothetical protein
MAVLLPDGLVEYALQIPLGQGGTFQVLLGLDLPATGQTLFVLHGRRAHLSHAFLCCLVIPKVQLGTNKDDGNTGGVVFNFRRPLATR